MSIYQQVGGTELARYAIVELEVTAQKFGGKNVS